MRRIIILLVMTLFLAGCYGGGSPRRSSARYDDDFHQGYEGLYMQFVEGSPPYKIYAPNGNSDEYYIMLEVENRGSYDTTDNQFILSGYDAGIFILGGGSTSYFQSTPPIEGRSSNNPAGGFQTVRWTVDSTELPEGIDRFDQTFMVSTCYDYQTTASIAVCIDPRPWEFTSKEKVCVPDHVSVSGGQGAPVAISNVEVTPMNNKVQMKIEIQNVGGGRVVSNDVPFGFRGDCPFNLEYEDLNRVELTRAVVAGINGVCTPNEIIMVNDRANIYCTFDPIDQDGRNDAFMSTLDLTLVYKYTSSITRNVEVMTVPG